MHMQISLNNYNCCVFLMDRRCAKDMKDVKLDAMPDWIKHVPVEHKIIVIAAWRKAIKPPSASADVVTTSAPMYGMNLLRTPSHPLAKLKAFEQIGADATTGCTDGKEDETVAKGDASCSTINSVLEMESNLLGKTNKKGKAGTSADPAVKTKTKGGKKGKNALKRPAAAMVDIAKIKPNINMKDCFDKLRVDGLTLSRNTFQSRAYDTAKRRMISKGASKENTSIVARWYHASAGKLYEELA
jgi:hypothetical protein